MKVMDLVNHLKFLKIETFISAFLEKREATFKKLADVKDFDETGS